VGSVAKGGGRFAAILLFCLGFALCGRSENRVLELDGKNSYVELPRGIFTNLTEATVEMWFNFTALNNAGLFAYGSLEHDFGIGNHWEGPHLTAFVNRRTAGGALSEAQARNVLEPNRWFHVAVTLGANRLRLYLDGVPVAAHPATNSLADVDPAGPFFLGKMVLRPQLAHAKLDEVRVWTVARSEAQIRENMFQKLNGREPSLVALWNFDDPAEPGRDAGAGGHHGRLMAGARTIPEELPQQLATFRQASVLELHGEGDFVTLPDGLLNGLEEATVELWANWSALHNFSRPFDFHFGDASWALMNRFDTNMLGTELFSPRGLVALSLEHFIRTNEWMHLAVSCGKEKLTLYANGQYVPLNPKTASFQLGPVPLTNFLGRANARTIYPQNRDFQGQLDEVRVWRGVRSETEIRQDMFRDLTGREPNLVGLWAFDDPANPGKDLTGRAGPAQLHGRAGIASSTRPQQLGVQQNCFLAGQLRDSAGRPQEGRVQLFLAGTELPSGPTDETGQYVLALRGVTNAFDLQAVAGDLHAWQLGLAVGHPTGARTEGGNQPDAGEFTQCDRARHRPQPGRIAWHGRRVDPGGFGARNSRPGWRKRELGLDGDGVARRLRVSLRAARRLRRSTARGLAIHRVPGWEADRDPGWPTVCRDRFQSGAI
jgi:hypothetical protein